MADDDYSGDSDDELGAYIYSTSRTAQRLREERELELVASTSSTSTTTRESNQSSPNSPPLLLAAADSAKQVSGAEENKVQKPLQVNDPLSTLTAAAAACTDDNDDIAEETSPAVVLDHGKSPPANASSASRNAEDNEMVVSPPKESTENKLISPPAGEQSGRWTKAEHDTFLLGLETHGKNWIETHGKNWKLLAGMIKTRTAVQTRTHAQKYFLKLQRWDVKKKKVCYIIYIYVVFLWYQISNTYSFLFLPETIQHSPLSAGRVDKDNDTIDY